MRAAAKTLPNLKTAVAVSDALEKQDYFPMELMEHLQREQSLSDAVIKEAIWKLIEEERIELSSDQKLTLSGPAANPRRRKAS